MPTRGTQELLLVMREFMMMWVALAFTTGTLFRVSVEDEGVMADGFMLVSPSSSCAEEARDSLRRKGQNYLRRISYTTPDPQGKESWNHT